MRMYIVEAAAVLQWARPFVPQGEGWVSESKPRQTFKTGSDSSTAKRSTLGVNVTGPWR